MEKWETWGKYEKIKIEKSWTTCPLFVQDPKFWVFYPILPNVSLTFESQAIFKKSPMAVFMYPIEQIRLRIQSYIICIGQIMIWSHLGSVSKKIEDFWKKNWKSKLPVLLRQNEFSWIQIVKFLVKNDTFCAKTKGKRRFLQKPLYCPKVFAKTFVSLWFWHRKYRFLLGIWQFVSKKIRFA